MVRYGVLLATCAILACSNGSPSGKTHSDPRNEDGGGGRAKGGSRGSGESTSIGSTDGSDAGSGNAGGMRSAGAGGSQRDGGQGQRGGAGGAIAIDASREDAAPATGTADAGTEVTFTIVPPPSTCGAAGAAGSPNTVPDPGIDSPPSSGHQCDSSFEPNDTTDDACRISLGAAVDTWLTKSTDGTDNFVFHAEAGVTYTLTVSMFACRSGDDLGITVAPLSMATTSQPFRVTQPFGTIYEYEVTPDTTGDELLTFAATETCQYRFNILQPTAQGLKHDADYEPNDTWLTATPLEANPRVSTKLEHPYDSADLFTFPVLGNVTYSVHVSTLKCIPRPSSLNFISVTGAAPGAPPPDSNLWEDVSAGTSADFEFTSTMSGDERFAFSGPMDCEYEFYVTPSSICGLRQGPGYEPNNTASTAAPIAVGKLISSEITQPADSLDYYSFEVSPHSMYTLTFSTAGCTGSAPNNYLGVTIWTRQAYQTTIGVPPEAARFSAGQNVYPFVTGDSNEEVLLIQSRSSCAYDFTITKD